MPRNGHGGGSKQRLSAEQLARVFANQFLAQGNFVDTGAMGLKAVPAASQRYLDFDEPSGFAGLSVQAVLHASGPAADGESDLPDEVHIFVTRGSKKELNSLPEEIAGIRVLAHNTGKVSIRSRTIANASNRGLLFERDGRVACGSSCAPSGKNYAGTFGALVKIKGKQGLYALSNNHVFADCNHVPIGMPIQAPAGADVRPSPARPPSVICEHAAIVELRSGCPTCVSRCQADIAIASVPDPDEVSSWQGDDDEGFDTPTVTRNPQRRLLVKKFGRTTGLTHGIIVSRVIEFDLPYQSENFSALVWFQDVWSVQTTSQEPFALPGDSGSLIVTEDGAAVVGILFAATPKGGYGYIAPVGCIESAFGGLTFVSGHGV